MKGLIGGTAALVLMALLNGCATTTVPEPLREAPAGNPQVSEVRNHIKDYIGQTVRWGGTIAGVSNHTDETWIEVVARPLSDRGIPEDGDTTQGRFIARVQGFLEPVVYSQGRAITVVGKVSGETSAKIGDYDYRYPVVDVTYQHLWEPPPEPSQVEYVPAWYYDPWYPYYYPYYPYAFPWR